MRYLLLLLPLFFWGCPDNNQEWIFEDCPYEMQFSGHFLRIPITVAPHQMQYRVGDTIRVGTSSSNRLQDLSSGETFEIDGFPFEPLTLLYRVSNTGEWDPGYRINTVIPKPAFEHHYNYSTDYADGFRSRTLFDSTRREYDYHFDLVLTQPGRYVMVFTDMYQERLGGGVSERNAAADAITFEGKCPNAGYYLCSMIDSGDPHLEEFMPEIIHLEETVYRGKLASIGAGSLGPLRSGGITIEWSGFYGFEVVE